MYMYCIYNIEKVHFLKVSLLNTLFKKKQKQSNTPGGEPPLHSSTPFSGLIKSFENKPSSPYAPTFDQSSSQVRQSETFLQVNVF